MGIAAWAGSRPSGSSLAASFSSNPPTHSFTPTHTRTRTAVAFVQAMTDHQDSIIEIMPSDNPSGITPGQRFHLPTLDADDYNTFLNYSPAPRTLIIELLKLSWEQLEPLAGPLLDYSRHAEHPYESVQIALAHLLHCCPISDKDDHFAVDPRSRRSTDLPLRFVFSFAVLHQQDDSTLGQAGTLTGLLQAAKIQHNSHLLASNELRAALEHNPIGWKWDEIPLLKTALEVEQDEYKRLRMLLVQQADQQADVIDQHLLALLYTSGKRVTAAQQNIPLPSWPTADGSISEQEITVRHPSPDVCSEQTEQEPSIADTTDQPLSTVTKRGAPSSESASSNKRPYTPYKPSKHYATQFVEINWPNESSDNIDTIALTAYISNDLTPLVRQNILDIVMPDKNYIYQELLALISNAELIAKGQDDCPAGDYWTAAAGFDLNPDFDSVDPDTLDITDRNQVTRALYITFPINWDDVQWSDIDQNHRQVSADARVSICAQSGRGRRLKC